MQEIEGTIRIKIEKIITKNEGIQEIPVRIKKEVKELISLDQLDDLVENFLASKSEFRFWKEQSKNSL